MPEKTSGFLRHLLGQVAGQGRGLIDWAFRSTAPAPLEQAPLMELVRLLLHARRSFRRRHRAGNHDALRCCAQGGARGLSGGAVREFHGRWERIRAALRRL